MRMRRTHHSFEKIYSPKYVVNLAREMRSGMTEAEEVLWSRLRRRQIDGLRFRKQHPFGRYIADFCCHEARLIIELDGGSHDGREKYDRNRDEFLAGGGYTVLRFTNEDVLHGIEKVIDAIRTVARKINSMP
jgi:very-short-patch-repair endonuclease